MRASTRVEALAQQATFVFRGTVQRLQAATMDQVPVDARTAIVRVDSIVMAPDALSSYSGKEITVQLGGRQKVEVGQELVFFTNEWLYGKSVAVQSVGQKPVGKATAALEQADADPVERLAQRTRRAHVDEADMVL